MSGEAFPQIVPWLGMAVLALMVGVFFLGRMVPRQAAILHVTPSVDRLDQIFKRFDEIEERLGHCEHDSRNIRTVVRELPTKDVVKELSERVSAVGGQLNAMTIGLSANTSTLGRIQDFLMDAAAESIAGIRKADSDKGSQG